MPRLKLTDSVIEKLPFPNTGTAWYLDPDLKGFQLARGTKTSTFYAIKSLGGRNVRKKLGQWPMVRAREAREIAMRALGDISKGVDPRPKKTRTLRETLTDYIDSYSHASHGRLSEVTAQQYVRCLELHCPKWLALDMSRITKVEVAKLHRDLRHKPYMANQCLRVIRMMYKHAIDTVGIEMPDPTRGVRFFPEHKRETKIDDWAAWFDEVAVLPIVRKQYYLLAALTGIRRSDLSELEWARVDLQRRTIKLENIKNGTSPTLPLSAYAVEVLTELRPLHHKWVFPANSRSGHMEEPKEEGVRGRIHDLRRMFTTAGARCHLPEYIIARLRGDIHQQTVVQGYMGDVSDHSSADKIGEYLRLSWMRVHEIKVERAFLLRS